MHLGRAPCVSAPTREALARRRLSRSVPALSTSSARASPRALHASPIALRQRSAAGSLSAVPGSAHEKPRPVSGRLPIASGTPPAHRIPPRFSSSSGAPDFSTAMASFRSFSTAAFCSWISARSAKRICRADCTFLVCWTRRASGSLSNAPFMKSNAQ